MGYFHRHIYANNYYELGEDYLKYARGAEGLPAEGLPAEGLPAEVLPAEVLPAEVLPDKGLPDEEEDVRESYKNRV